MTEEEFEAAQRMGLIGMEWQYSPDGVYMNGEYRPDGVYRYGKGDYDPATAGHTTYMKGYWVLGGIPLQGNSSTFEC